MNDKFLMQSHKLHWHLDRVLQWQRGESIAPLHIDAGLSRGCNIRCHYCFGAMQGNEFKKGMQNFLPKDILLNYVRDAAEIGVRSMSVIGEAEPLVNPFAYEAIVEGKKAGMDMALATNGVLLDTGTKGQMALEHLEWIRFNISAATDEAYRKIHGSRDFNIAVEKIKFCVEYKRKMNLKLVIGLQMVLTPLDLYEAVPLAMLGKELGVDYLVIKQCSDTTENTLGIYDHLKKYTQDDFTAVLKEAESHTSENYQVIVKWKQLTNCGVRNYTQCLGAPFILHTAGDGRIYSCAAFFDKRSDEMLLGNLYKDRFKDIVVSEQYRKVLDKVTTTIDCQKECYSNCRTNNINEYLWELQHPPMHKNFI